MFQEWSPKEWWCQICPGLGWGTESWDKSFRKRTKGIERLPDTKGLRKSAQRNLCLPTEISEEWRRGETLSIRVKKALKRRTGTTDQNEGSFILLVPTTCLSWDPWIWIQVIRSLPAVVTGAGSFFPQISMEKLPCLRHCSRHYGYSCKQDRHAVMELTFY